MIKQYIVATIIFLLIDAVWLLLIAKDFYKKEIGHLMSSNPNLIAALIFYLIFIAGLVIFVINPALEKESLKQVILMGLLFGIVTYATYDLTNLATLKDFPLKVALIDLIWGGSVSTIVSTLTFLLLK